MKDTACIAIDLGATSGRVILAKMKHGRLETEILNRFPNVIKEIDVVIGIFILCSILSKKV